MTLIRPNHTKVLYSHTNVLYPGFNLGVNSANESSQNLYTIGLLSAEWGGVENYFGRSMDIFCEIFTGSANFAFLQLGNARETQFMIITPYSY